MSKRSRAALHSELEEYASLVRALRTSKTLDLASHLTQFSQNQTQQSASEHGSVQHSASDYEDDAEENLNDLPRTSSAPPTSDVYDEDGEDEIDYGTDTANGKGKKRAFFKARGANKRRLTSFNERDTWTRWPLLSGDVHIPTWGLDDEVAALSTNILRMQRQPKTQHLSTSLPASSTSLATRNSGAASELSSIGGEEIFGDIDDDLEAEDEKLHLSHLATSTALTLSRLLSTLAQYVPPVEKSLRNRLAPLDWSAVLRAAKAGNLGLDSRYVYRRNS